MPNVVGLQRPAATRPWIFGAAWVIGAALMVALLLLDTDRPALAATATAAIAALLAGLTAAGALSQRCGFLARPINGVRAAGSKVFLTFDDGPDPRTTPEVLRLLAASGHRATFFVIGERAAEHPQLLREIHRAGHDIGLHSMAHRWHFCFWPPTRLVDDLAAVRQVIEASGAVAAPLFRPPIAILSPRIAAASRRAGLRLIGYTARALDGRRGASTRRCLRRLRRGLRPGGILALHDTARSAGPRLLPELLEDLSGAGLVGAPLSEVLSAIDDRDGAR